MREEFAQVYIHDYKPIAMVKHVFTDDEINLRMSIVNSLLEYEKRVGKSNWNGDKEKIINGVNSLLANIQNTETLWTTNNKEHQDYAQYLFDLHTHVWNDVLDTIPFLSDRERHGDSHPRAKWEECNICGYRRRKEVNI